MQQEPRATEPALRVPRRITLNPPASAPKREDSATSPVPLSFRARGHRYAECMTPRHDSDQFRRRSGSDADLLADLRRMDSRPYGSYKSVIGDWDYGDFQLSIDRVQSDPYAPPSAIRAITAPKTMGLPEEALSDGRSRLATADFLARAFDSAIAERARGKAVRIARTGQEILQRSSVTVMPDRVEIRFQVQLPARGRSILGREAARIFDIDVPNIVMDAFDFISEDEVTRQKRSALLQHIAVYED